MRKINVLLVSQYREAVGEEFWKLSPAALTAMRMLKLPSSGKCRKRPVICPEKLVRLGGYYLAPGYSTEFMHLYLAADLVPSRLTAEDTEGIKLVKKTVPEIRKMLADGKIRDGKSIAGLIYVPRVQE